MAVFTDIDEGSLTALLQNYAIGEMRSYHGIAEGVENSNFLLKTTENTYILTLFEQRVAKEDLPYFVQMMTHFATRNIPCPVPITDTHHKALQELCGKPALIVSFLEGCSVTRPTASHCAALGSFLATFHLTGLDFKGHRPNTMNLAAWEGLLLRVGNKAKELSPELPALFMEELGFLKAHYPTNLPKGVIHADLFPDNVFFQGDTLSGVIDFYFACNDFLVYDVAICLNAWCFEKDGSFNLTKAQNLLSGYNNIRSLSRAELNALPLLARAAAIRFLSTRLHDWFNRAPNAILRPKNPLEYVNILKFQQQIKSVKEYGFYD